MSGIEAKHELKVQQQLVDVRPVSTRLGEWLAEWQNFVIVQAFLWVLTVMAPVSGLITLPAIAGFSIAFVAVRQLLPYRYPHDRRDEKGKPGDAICYFGSVDESSPYERFKEIWLSDSDLRTHIFILATTGAGKSEALKAIFFNALNWSSGFFIADGKADNQMPLDTYTMVRSRGRDYDYLCLNFLLAGKTPEQAKRARRRRTNGINPFSVADSDTIIQMGANLMPKVEGEAKMWQEKGLNLWRAEVTALCYKRDTQGFNISVTTFLDYMALPKLEQLYMEGYHEAQARGGIWTYGFLGIKSYLEAGLPGFKVDRLLRKHGIETLPPAARGGPGIKPPPTEQETQAYEQHSYRTNQLMPVLGLLDKTYGYIFQNKFSEIDMTDVVLRRRILCMLIPSLEKSAAEAENLGKLAIACLRVMMARNLGSEVEGTAEELLGRKATLAPYPYTVALDELGYYFSDGLAVMFAQARSLGASMIAAAQDVEMLMSGSRGAEAGAMMANQNIQVFGKLGDAGKTAEIYQKALGQVTVALKRDYQLGALGYHRTVDVSIEKIDRASTNDLRSLKAGESFITFGGVVRRMKWFYMGDDNAANRVPYFQVNRFLQIEPPTPEEIVAHSIPMEQLNDPYQRGTELVKRLTEPIDAFEFARPNAVVAAIAKAAHQLPVHLPAQERAIALYMAAREALQASVQPAPSTATAATHGQEDAPPGMASSPAGPEHVGRDGHGPGEPLAQGVSSGGDPNEEVDPLAFLSPGGTLDPTFARKKASEVIGMGQGDDRTRLMQDLAQLTERPEADPSAAVDARGTAAAAAADPFDAMLSDGAVTYKLKEDLSPSRGRVIAQLVGAPAEVADPVTGLPVDSQAAWIGDALLDFGRINEIQPAADGTVVGMTEQTLERVQEAERALGSPDPMAAARAAEQVAAARVTVPTSAKAPLDDSEIDAAMKVLTL